MSVKVLEAVKPGLVLGDDVQKVFVIARENELSGRGAFWAKNEIC